MGVVNDTVHKSRDRLSLGGASPEHARAAGVAPADHDRPLRVGGASLYGLRARLVRGVSWNLVATVFMQGSTFLVNLIFANLWGLRLFGEYAIVQSTSAVLTAVAQPTTATTATKYLAELRSRDPHRAGRILGLVSAVSLGLGVVAGGVLLVGSREIATAILHTPDLTTVLMIAGLVVFFNIISGSLAGALAGLESYAALGKAGIAAGVGYVAVCAVAGWRWGLVGALIGLAVSAVLQALVLLAALTAEMRRHGIHATLRDGWQEAPMLFKFVAPAAFSGLVAFPALWLGNAFLVRREHGYEQMALFAAGNNLRILVLFLPNIVNNVGMSLLNNQRGAGHEGRYRQVFWMNLAVSAAIVVLGAAAVTVAGPALLGFFGRDYRAGYRVLAVLMLAAVPETIAISMIQMIQSQERVWLSFLGVTIPGYGTLVVMAALLTGGYGARGLAWSYVGGMSVELIASALIVARLGLWQPSPGRSLDRA